MLGLFGSAAVAWIGESISETRARMTSRLTPEYLVIIFTY